MNDVNESSCEEGLKLRSIEKCRISSCKFADVIAECVVNHFNGLYIDNEEVYTALHSISSQNCLSAFLLLDNEELSVVSLGVGTKIVSEDVSKEDYHKGERVVDCHAEVIARRAFIRFLYSQIRAAQRNEKCIFKNGCTPYELREEVSFHLYCSSAPCGNACIRRWAKGQKENYRYDLSDFQWPDQKHHVFTKHSEIQISVLCKVRLLSLDHAVESSLNSMTSEFVQSEKKKNEELFIPPGTCLLTSPLASSRASCSDKIARWCAIGSEGAFFSSLLSPKTPFIRPKCIVIGRKFCRPHAERAICCRLTKFWGNEHHPVILCSHVKLQEGGMPAESKASFKDFALVWALESDNQHEAEVLRSTEGLTLDGTPSFVSRVRILELYSIASGVNVEFSKYYQVKNEVSSVERKQRLNRLLDDLINWPRYRYRNDAFPN